MGAIQSAINSGMTTLAAGVGAAKKILPEAEQAKAEKAKAIEEKKSLELEQNKIKADTAAELARTEEAILTNKDILKEQKSKAKFLKNGGNLETASYDAATGETIGSKYPFTGDKETDEKKRIQLNYDMKKFRTAIKVSNANIQALKAQRAIYKNMLGGKADE